MTIIDKLRLKFYGLLGYALTPMIKTDKNLWLIGACDGKNYADNSRYFFDWLNVYATKQITVYWITQNKQIIKNIPYQGRVLYFYSINTQLMIARAQVYICSHGINDITPYVTKNKFIFCLWHGLPVKKLGKLTGSNRGKTGKMEKYLISIIRAKTICDAFLTPSDFFQKIFAAGFSDKIKEYIVAPYPRVSTLLSMAGDNKIKPGMVLYAPTFRDNVAADYYFKQQILPGQQDLPELLDTLRQYNMTLCIKLHPYINIINKDLSYLNHELINIIDPTTDVLPVLLNAEILITDYSGIFFDFMLLDRKIIFYAPDIDWYEQTSHRGLYVNYNEFIPGVCCQTWREVFTVVVNERKVNERTANGRSANKNHSLMLNEKYQELKKIANQYPQRDNFYIYNKLIELLERLS